MLIPMRISWILLSLLIIFDYIVSFYGVNYQNGREGNLLIAPMVERYPLLYFIFIPLTIIIMIIISKLLKLIAVKLLKKWRIGEKSIEQILLGALVIYWAIANSSGNLIFLLGYRIPIDMWWNMFWPILSIAGFICSLLYALFLLKAINRI